MGFSGYSEIEEKQIGGKHFGKNTHAKKPEREKNFSTISIAGHRFGLLNFQSFQFFFVFFRFSFSSWLDLRMASSGGGRTSLEMMLGLVEQLENQEKFRFHHWSWWNIELNRLINLIEFWFCVCVRLNTIRSKIRIKIDFYFCQFSSIF